MYEIIEINGKKLPIKFGFSALRKFSKITGMKLQDMEVLGNNMTLDSAITMIHCAIVDGHRVAKEECTYTSDDLADDLDTDMEAIERAMNIFAEMMSGAEKKEKVKKKIVKKGEAKK
tara:strand:+ start:4183 stop:4533 length:351 start_codon:yes stop_codon:yes gene_type:complete